MNVNLEGHNQGEIVTFSVDEDQMAVSHNSYHDKRIKFKLGKRVQVPTEAEPDYDIKKKEVDIDNIQQGDFHAQNGMNEFTLGSSKPNHTTHEEDEEWMDKVPKISRTNIACLKDNNMTDDNASKVNTTHFSKPRIQQFHSNNNRNASVRQSYPTATQSISQQDRDENDMLDTVELKNIQKMQEITRMSTSVSDNKLQTRAEPSGGRPFVVPKHELEILLDRDQRVNACLKSFSLDDHSEIKWHHRAILLDWTLEVCSELGLKRQTWQLATNLLDRQLVQMKTLPERKLQLYGVACLQLASKQEEIQSPRASDFAATTDGGQTGEEVKDAEREVLSRLQWEVTGMNSLEWLQLFTADWDRFASTDKKIAEVLFFRKPSRTCQRAWREATTLLDACYLCSQAQGQCPRVLCLSVLYLVYGRRAQLGGMDEASMNAVFNSFLAQGIDWALKGLSFVDLLPCLKFVNKFMSLKVDMSPPSFSRLWGKDSRVFTESSHMYEEFLDFQTQNKDILKQVTSIWKKGQLAGN